MKLRALYLTNVRKFTAKRAAITGIGDGITVVSEANEFGKSTFFDAIHALFFEKHTSTGKPVKSLRPYTGGAVEIAADVETDDGLFRLEKRFLSRNMARITQLSDQRVIAQDDEAERWISDLLGTAGDGPAGLLWVRQGLVGLEPDSVKEKSDLMETRRDLLSSVTGEIDALTGGRLMDRVMRRVVDELAGLTTKTGRKTGVWKAASDEVEQLETDLSKVSAQVTRLETALGDRKLTEAALKRFDDPELKSRRDSAVQVARAELETAKAYAGRVTVATQARDLADHLASAARQKLDAFLAAIITLGHAEA
ncbi:MAG: AAA family ATPase, partial [Deltaproteobacteria bacterium]